MTIEELEDQLPNGFHDSFIVSAAVDFAKGTCCVEIDVDYDHPDPNVFRRMRLELSGLSLFVIEPPDNGEVLSAGTICTSGSATSEQTLKGLDSYLKNAPSDTFFYSFYLDHLNCFLHVAARDARLESIQDVTED